MHVEPLRVGAAGRAQIGRSIDAWQLRQVTFAVSLMRAIVECSPQSGQSERSS